VQAEGRADSVCVVLRHSRQLVVCLKALSCSSNVLGAAMGGIMRHSQRSPACGIAPRCKRFCGSGVHRAASRSGERRGDHLCPVGRRCPYSRAGLCTQRAPEIEGEISGAVNRLFAAIRWAPEPHAQCAAKVQVCADAASVAPPRAGREAGLGSRWASAVRSAEAAHQAWYVPRRVTEPGAKPTKVGEW
jgi:hypothetical protein